MLTKDDIKKLMVVFATKQGLRNSFSGLREEFNLRFDKVMNMLDKVVGELKDIRQEQKAHYGQHDRINERLEKLESRSNTN